MTENQIRQRIAQLEKESKQIKELLALIGPTFNPAKDELVLRATGWVQ